MRKYQQGQSLIMLLFFVMVGLTITITAMTVIATNSLGAGDIQQGEIARQMAESGAERGLLKVLRGDFSSESFAGSPDGTIDISITNGTPIDIVSTATSGNYIKKVEVKASYIDNDLTLVSWKEVN